MTTAGRPLFPFSAIAGQERMKLALILNAINPLIGGALISGTRGAAKSTAVRGLAEILPPPTPFVNLPVGATEDRVLGTLDIENALKRGEKRFEPGLLAQAHNGILYIDEVNLLPDHLVDVILDAVAMGVHRVEREGISHEHAANIILIGTMNPEEGELRPQLLDRFGLCATVESMTESGFRKEALQRRLLFDADPAAFCSSFAGEQAALTDRIVQARVMLSRVSVPDGLLDSIVRMAAEAGADGLRADLSLHRAVRALAAWEKREVASAQDLDTVAELALAHRRRRKDSRTPPASPPPSAPPKPPSGRSQDTSSPRPPDSRGKENIVLGFGEARNLPWRDHEKKHSAGTRSRVVPGRGKGAREAARGQQRVSLLRTAAIAFPETIRKVAAHRGGSSLLPLGLSDCMWKRKVQRPRKLVVFVVDASGSMAALSRMRAAKAAALALLEKAYHQRCSIAVIAFRNDTANVLLHPTRSAFLAFRELRELSVGGATPLADGLRSASDLIARSFKKDPDAEPFLVLITDGRATHPVSTGFSEAAAEASAIGARGWQVLCIDTESGLVRLGQTRAIAALLNAAYVHTEELPRANWTPIIEEWLSWR